MNLSHPEQYFSDLLSTLELPGEDQHLELMTHSVAAAPALLQEGGKLRIPPNVWFVGTANHDETTMDFADKTYDRSHVMEFPVRPERFEVQDASPRRPISFGALQRAFEEAIRRHGASAEEAIGFLDSQVRDRLARDFHVGWVPGSSGRCAGTSPWSSPPEAPSAKRRTTCSPCGYCASSRTATTTGPNASRR